MAVTEAVAKLAEVTEATNRLGKISLNSAISQNFLALSDLSGNNSIKCDQLNCVAYGDIILKLTIQPAG